VQFVQRENAPERLVCEAELIFDGDMGPLAGMKLVGFCLWRSAEGEVFVTFPSRAFGVGNDRKLWRGPSYGEIALDGRQRRP